MWSRESVEVVYRRHGFAVFKRCLGLLRDEAEAQDVAHEVFLKLLASPDEFRGAASGSTYLFAIATNLSLNRLRNQRARGAVWEAAVASSLDVRAPTAEGAAGAREIVRRILEDTDEQTALIAVYHFVDGLSQGEIASLVGLSRLTVNRRLQELRAGAKAVEAQ